jgi:hypothetical protein
MGEWVTLGKTAYATINAYPIEYKVVSYIVVAFVVVMFLEGIRSSFFKRRHYD